ncbi:MAG: 3-dehydroquinate synthase [Candidatus Peregrinibacteria bacterium]
MASSAHNQQLITNNSQLCEISLTPPTNLPHPYPIIVGKGVLKELPEILKSKGMIDHIVVLHDQRVETIAKNVAMIVGTKNLISIPSGEKTKTLSNLENLAEKLTAIGATRSTLLIAVGGGMTTDLVGFLASIYMRGIRVIHIPTSMLGMVDAAIGGKTAVDLPGAKNILGTVHHPSAIIADTELLASLPEQQFNEGLVEVIKKAAILDAKTFAWFEKAMPQILKRDEEALMQCITEAARLKAEVVSEDDRDAHHRHFLNFGHTVGHAVESFSHFAISHGQAVSIGIAIEMKIVGTKGADRVLALLHLTKMPTEIPSEYPIAALWNIMQSDKKKKDGVVRIFVPTAIGTGEARPLTFEEFSAAAKE